jgi:hypothetical protein
LDLSATPIERVVMLINTSLGMLLNETSEPNIEKAVDCSILYKNNELLTRKGTGANSLPVN